MNPYPRYLPVVGRVLIAAIFLLGGFGKITAPAMTQG
jgi:putative oxidoreductase